MNLLRSRTFITCLLDALVKAATLIASKYAAPETAAMLHDLWLIAQPVVLFLVTYFTVNDFAAPVVQRAISRELTTRGLPSATATPACFYQPPPSAAFDPDKYIRARVVGEIGGDAEPESGT
ncbi:MAG: hypothetical protein WAU96_02965 [Anaerolineae bacterium]